MTPLEAILLLALIGAWLAIVVEGAVLLELLRQTGQIRGILPRQGAMILQEEGLPAGTLVEDPSDVFLLDGSKLTMSRDSKASVVMLLTPECNECRQVAGSFIHAEASDVRQVRLLFVIKGDRKLVGIFAREFGLQPREVAVDPDGLVAQSLNVRTYPSAVVLSREQRTLGHGVINTVDQALALAQRIGVTSMA